jgi:hypothetical protein
MNLRFLASAAALQSGRPELAWQHVQLPQGTVPARDLSWRRELLEELIAGRCELCDEAD